MKNFLISVVLIFVISTYTINLHAELNNNCTPYQPINQCTEINCIGYAISAFANYQRSIEPCMIASQTLPKIYFANKDQPQKTAKSIIMIHGLTNSVDSLIGLAKKFQSKGYNVINMTLHGHGGSDAYLMKNASESQWKKDLLFAVHIAKMLGESTEALGHSTGGTYITDFALSYPKLLSKIYLLDPAIRLNGTEASAASWSCTAHLLYNYTDTASSHLLAARTAVNFIKNSIVSKAEARTLNTSISVDPICSQLTTYNYRLPTSGACALLNVQNELKERANLTEELPPATVLLTVDDKRYQQISNNQKLALEFLKSGHKVIQIKDVLHGYLPSTDYRCNSHADEMINALDLL